MILILAGFLIFIPISGFSLRCGEGGHPKNKLTSLQLKKASLKTKQSFKEQVLWSRYGSYFKPSIAMGKSGTEAEGSKEGGERDQSSVSKAVGKSGTEVEGSKEGGERDQSSVSNNDLKYWGLQFASQYIKKGLIDLQLMSPAWLDQQVVIKRVVQRKLQKEVKEIIKDATNLFKEFPRTVLLPFRFHVKELKLFSPEDRDIISVRLKVYIYTGGAHGNSAYYSWNYSQKRKAFLSLDDVITSVQFTDIVRRVRRQLGKEDYMQKDHIKRGTSKKEDFNIWNMHKKGISFVFPEYQVAAYSAGNFEVFVPLSDKKAK